MAVGVGLFYPAQNRVYEYFGYAEAILLPMATMLESELDEIKPMPGVLAIINGVDRAHQNPKALKPRETLQNSS